jgi:hypothetical protein
MNAFTLRREARYDALNTSEMVSEQRPVRMAAAIYDVWQVLPGGKAQPHPVQAETLAGIEREIATEPNHGEVAALFDVSPWLTRFELWHRKNGTIATPEFNARNVDGSPVNSRIHWGVKLENLIIQEACERWGYEPIETPSRVDNGAGLGGHPDRVVWCPDRKAKVVLEAKSVDWLQRKKWGDEPPTQYLLQPNTYAGLLKAEHFDVVTMVLGGNTDIERSQNLFGPSFMRRPSGALLNSGNPCARASRRSLTIPETARSFRK